MALGTCDRTMGCRSRPERTSLVDWEKTGCLPRLLGYINTAIRGFGWDHSLVDASFTVGTNSEAVARRSEVELDCMDTSLMVVRRTAGWYCALRPRIGREVAESSYSSSASLEWTLPDKNVSTCTIGEILGVIKRTRQAWHLGSLHDCRVRIRQIC